MAESPAGVYSPSCTTITTTWKAFTIFCFFSLPHSLLKLNNNPLTFNLIRILSSQTRAQSTCTPLLHQLLKTKKPNPDTAELLSSLTPHSLNCRFWKDSCCCSCQRYKKNVSGNIALYSSSVKLCVNVVKDIWCSSIKFLAHKR